MTESTIRGECPLCQAEMTLERPELVEAEEDKVLKEAILSGSFFKAHCPSCGKDFIAATPLLYYDRRRTAIIQLVPGYTGTGPLFGEEIFAALQVADSGQPVRVIRRVVTTPNELTEKIHLLDAGYDDRLVEIGKVIALQQVKDQLPNLTGLRQVRYAPKTDQHEAQLLFFYDHEVPSMDFPQSFYDSIGLSFVEALVTTDPEEDLVVDANWAVRFLKKAGSSGDQPSAQAKASE